MRDINAQDTTTLNALSTQPIYNVKAVCQRTGITAARLRAWERRYQLLSPDRTIQNYRLYSEYEIGILFWLLNQVNSGTSARNAMAQLQSLIRDHESIPVQMHVPPPPTNTEMPRSPARLSGEIADALLAFKSRRADELIQEALALYTIDTVFVNILRGSLSQVRDIRREGETNMAGEQYAVNYIRQRLINMLQTTPIIRDQRTVLLIGFPEEQTEIDILVLSLLLRRRGWVTLNIGGELEPALLTHALSVVNAGVVLFYADLPRNVHKLIGFPPAYDQHSQPVRMVLCGHASENYPDLQFPIDSIEYLGYDLKFITAELNDYLLGLDQHQDRNRERTLPTRPTQMNQQIESGIQA